MRLGFPISLLLHALILGWGLIAMKSTRDFKKPDVQPIALEIITADELAQMRKGDEKSKEKEIEAAKDSQSQAQKEPPKPKPKPVVAPPPPPPEPVKEEPKPEEVLKEMAKTEPKPPEPKPPEVEPPPPPKEEPKPDDILKEMAKAEPKPAPPPPPPKPPDPPPKAAEKPKPAPPKPKPVPKVAVTKPAPTPPVKPGHKPSTFDAQQIAALIDKSPNAPAAASTASPTPAKTARTAAGARDGQGPKLSQNEQQALVGKLVAQIERCWRPPTGIPDAKSAIPVISFKLTRDGAVAGTPTIVNRLGTSSFQLASEAATRAIMQCQPYDMPADKYDGGWAEVELNFDPRGMF